MITTRRLLACSAPILLMLLSHSASAQSGGSTIRANIRPGSGDGKCTFEVEVDQVAEVEIRGDTGNLRTLSGSPAVWRRLDCNGALPSNPANFRFSGVDGRGRQDLVRSPNRGGSAVIRIEDPQGGREGYTGDVTWSGGSNYNSSGNNGGRWGNNGNSNGNYNGNNNGWNNGGWNQNGTGGWNGNGRSISIGDAMNICQNEVASESGANRNDVRVSGDSSNSDRGSFVVNFQIRSRNNRVSGTCRISRNGQIEDIRH